jgi:hypothetical protein
MATYRQDITQNIEPAMASPASLQRAAELQGKASQLRSEAAATLIKGGTELYKGYIQGEIDALTDTASNITQEFFVTNQAAQVAGSQLGTALQRREQFAQGVMGPLEPSQEEVVANTLAGFDSELNRLKMAAQGGMRPEQFVDRTNVLIKNAIAKFPGMADDIRKRVASVTGLEYGDRWAQMQFVKSQFGKQPASETTPEKLALKDIDAAAATGLFGTREELFNLYTSNRGQYDVAMNGFKQYLTAQSNANVIKNTVEGLQGQSDLQADQSRAAFLTIFDAGLASTVLTSTVQDKENLFGRTAQLMLQGDPNVVDPTNFKLLVDTHAAQMRANIESSRLQAVNALNAYLANNPNVSQAKREAMRADINNAANDALNKYADDKGIGLVAMATIFKSYRDKGLQEQQQLVDLAIRQQSAFQNSPLVMAYWAGGASRENLKQTQPDFYKMMQTMEENLSAGMAGVRDPIKAAASLANVQRTVLGAQQNPGPVAIDPTVDKTTTRASHQVLFNNATEILKKAELSPVEVNTISAALSTSTAYGANSQILAKDYAKLGQRIAQLPEPDQATIKGSVSSSIQQSITSIRGVKSTVEAKYGVTLQLGVNDAGQISVVMPRPEVSLGNRPLVTGGGNMDAAAKEFIQQVKPMLSNIVYGRAMLTQEQPKAVGQDFATIINNNQPYNGFFNMAAQPVTAPTANRAAPMAATMADIVEFATQEGISIEDAENQLRARGVTID